MLEDPDVSNFLHQLALGNWDRQQVEIAAVVTGAMDCIAKLWDEMTEEDLNRMTDEILQTSDEKTEAEKEVEVEIVALINSQVAEFSVTDIRQKGQP